MEGAQVRESSDRENSKSSQSLDKNLFKIIDVPGDGSCLFWATTLAYLVPVKYNEYAFYERFSRLFGFEETRKLTKIQELIQEYPSTNYVGIDKKKWLKEFVTKKFRERVIDEMSSNQHEIIQSITLDDILNSENAEYITDGTFKTEFTAFFDSSTSVEIEKLKPSSLNKNTIRIINEELEKVKDQKKCTLFKFRSYLQYMRERKAWGGHHEITAICQVLRCNVRVFSNTRTYPFNYPNSKDQIYLFHTSQNHYKFGLIQAENLIGAIRNPDMIQKAKSYVRLGIHDIDYQDNDGWTALHFAAQSGRIEIIRALLAQGASTEIINNRNKIPIQTAMSCATEVNGRNTHMEIAVILLDEKQPGCNLRKDEEKILFEYIEQYHPKITRELHSPESRQPNYSASDKADSSQPGLSADQPKSQREQESQSSENGLVSEIDETGSPVTETIESHVSSSTGSTTDQILNGNLQQTPKDLIDDEQATIAQSENQPCAQQPRDAGVSSTSQVVSSKNDVNSKAIICFQIESLEGTDILQIVMKCGNKKFEKNVEPQSHGKDVTSSPISEVIKELLQYLKSFEKQCILAAYECNAVDGPLLTWLIKKAEFALEFRQITEFVDIRQLICKKYPERGGNYSFYTSVKAAFRSAPLKSKIDTPESVLYWFEKLVNCEFEGSEREKIFQAVTSFDLMFERASKTKYALAERMETLVPLEEMGVSQSTLIKLAKAGITYALLRTTYREEEQKAIDLLEAYIKNKKTRNTILTHLSKSQNI